MGHMGHGSQKVTHCQLCVSEIKSVTNIRKIGISQFKLGIMEDLYVWKRTTCGLNPRNITVFGNDDCSHFMLWTELYILDFTSIITKNLFCSVINILLCKCSADIHMDIFRWISAKILGVKSSVFTLIKILCFLGLMYRLVQNFGLNFMRIRTHPMSLRNWTYRFHLLLLYFRSAIGEWQGIQFNPIRRSIRNNYLQWFLLRYSSRICPDEGF